MQGPPGPPYYAPRPGQPPSTGPGVGVAPPGHVAAAPPAPGAPYGAPRPPYGAPPGAPQPPVAQFQQMKVGGAPPAAPGGAVQPGAPPPGAPPPRPAGFPSVANGNGIAAHVPPAQPQYRPPGALAAPPARPAMGGAPPAPLSGPPAPPQMQQPRPPMGAMPGPGAPRPPPAMQQPGPVPPAPPAAAAAGSYGMPVPPGPRPPAAYPGAPVGQPAAPRPPGAVPPSPAAPQSFGTAPAARPPFSPQQQQQHVPPPVGGLARPPAPGMPPPGPPQVPGTAGLAPPRPPMGFAPPGQAGAPMPPMGAFPQAPLARPAGAYPPPPPGAFPGPPAAAGHPYQAPSQQPAPPTPLSPPGGFAPPSFGAPAPGSVAPGMAGPPPPGGAPPPPQPGGGMGGGRSIDPGSMPRPASLPPPTQVFETRREGTHTIPPPTEAPIVIRDCGSAGPRFMRCTLNSVPQGADMLKAASLPFVLLVNPLALPEAGDSAVEVVDPGPGGPLRCSECKAYVCPYMRWTEDGRKMECCFCGAASVVAPEAFCHVDASGRRTDADQRPELCRGSVEFEVGGEYAVRPPVPPTFFFLIEVTAAAVGSGATAAACASLAQLLDELPGGDRTRVGIATFDNKVHFYQPRESKGDGGDGAAAAAPTMLVMSDVGEPFCPLGGSCATVSLAQHKSALKALLESIPATFADSAVGDSAAGAALKSAVDALKLGVGGRIGLFMASLPRAGALALRPREAGRPPSERDALDVLLPEGKGYTALAQEAAEFQISVDIFALSQGYVDLATLAGMAAETSGSVHRYNPFSPAADSARFHNDLRWCLVRPQGFEAVARLRASAGVAVDNVVGAFHRRNPTDLHFPALSCDHAIAARLVHEERLREGSEVYLQYALLYTTTEGQRRVRVHTLALPVTRSLGSVFRGADLDAYVTYVARKVSAQLPGRTIAACRDVVVKSAVDTLVGYRKHVATASSSGQLILPEALRHLPLYSLGITKLPCFRTDARADSRAVWMFRLLTAPADRVVPALHPRLVALHTLPEKVGDGAPKIPERLWLTAERLDPEGIFLLENGFDAHVYVGSAVSPATCAALLGAPSPDAIDPTTWAGPPPLENPLSRAVAGLLDEVRRQRRAYMHLRLMRRGHPQEAAFMASLIEDRSPSAGASYVEHLCMLHRQIQNKLT